MVQRVAVQGLQGAKLCPSVGCPRKGLMHGPVPDVSSEHSCNGEERAFLGGKSSPP